MKLTFIKCHGSGNDFLLLDEYSVPVALTEKDRAEMAAALCNRETSIGADGILFFQKSKLADGRMRVFNADGSEASMCGNGLRCVARYACTLLGKQKLSIETMKAVLHCEQTEEMAPGVPSFKVEISPVSFAAESLPMHIGKEKLVNEKIESLSEQLLFSAVSVPNPHLITLVGKEQLSDGTQQQLASFLNGKNDYFPDGVNVSFVHPMEEGIFVKTFERGVGFTNACGTAMSASTLITCLLDVKSFGEEVSVYNPGGKVKCVAHQKEDGGYMIDLIGNATYVKRLNVEWTSEKHQYETESDFPEEAKSYDAFQKETAALVYAVLH